MLIDNNSENKHLELPASVVETKRHHATKESFDDFRLDFKKTQSSLDKSGKTYDKDFLRVLEANKRVIFDWGSDSLWVVEGDNEKDESKQRHFYAEEFQEASGYRGITSADTVLYMLVNGIEVDIRNAVGPNGTFKTKDELKGFYIGVKRMAQDIQK